MINTRLLLLLLSVSEFAIVKAGDVCATDNGYEFCDYGCCSGRCCGFSTIAIIGFVIGAVLSVAGLVGCIICLACMCKNSQHRSTPVSPMHNNNSVYVNNTPYHQPPSQPPAYNQYNSYPANSFNDPAYPPGTAHPPPAYSSENYK